jgi:RNA polymerase sigma-70 factor (ECF subfamily)
VDVAMDRSEPIGAPDRNLDPERLLADRRWIVALARGLMHGDAAAAEDVAQETTLRAWQRPPPDPSRRGGWLRRVASNVAARMRSSNAARTAREHAVASKEQSPATDELVARVHVQRAVADAVLALAEPYRTVVLLRFFDGLPPRAIAARLATPVETVRTRLKRALEQLRAKLDRDYGRRDAWAAVLSLPWTAASATTVLATSTTKLGVAFGAILVVSAVAWRSALGRFFGGNGVVAATAAAPAIAAAEDASSSTSRDRNVEPARVELAAPNEPSSNSSLLVRVTDDQGTPLVARIHAGRHDDVDLVATTDRDGTARLVPKPEWAVLVASSAGMQPEEVALATPRATEVTMCMKCGGSIHGVVVIGDTRERVGAGLRVVAVDSTLARYDAVIGHVAALSSGRAVGALTTTDDRGEFTIDGVEPGRSFFLYAGGVGFVTTPIVGTSEYSQDPQPAVSAGMDDAVVHVGLLYGMEFVVTQRGGAKLPQSDWFGPSIGGENATAARATIEDPFAAALTGLPLDARLPSHDHLRVLKYGFDPKTESVGPFGHYFDAAGFVGKEVEVMLPRVTGALPRKSIELEPRDGVRFGKLTVEVHGEDRVLGPGSSEGILGVVTVNATSKSRELETGGGWGTPLRFGRGHEIVVTGIPCGDYTWYFHPCWGNYQRPIVERGQTDNPMMHVHVDGDDARVVLDLSDCGDVEFDVVGRDGISTRQGVVLEVDPAPASRQTGTFFVGCRSMPFVVGAVRGGRYRARLSTFGLAHGREAADPVEFEVVPGSLTNCRITLSEDSAR